MISYFITFIARRRHKKKYMESRDTYSSSDSSKLSSKYLQNICESLKNEQHRDSTKKTYHKAWQLSNKFLTKLDKMPKRWEHRLELCVAYLVNNKKRESGTMKSYISGISACRYKNNTLYE